MRVKMKGPKGNNGFGFRGEFCESDENGIVEVPQEAVADALSHGFEITDQDEPKPVKIAVKGKDGDTGAKKDAAGGAQ